MSGAELVVRAAVPCPAVVSVPLVVRSAAGAGAGRRSAAGAGAGRRAAPAPAHTAQNLKKKEANISIQVLSAVTASSSSDFFF
jgi:hypothetical protein